MRTRTHLLQVWLNDEEYNTLNRRCKKSGLPKSTYIRQLIHGLQPRDLPPPDFRLMMRQLYYCGNSLNQIARKANALHVIDAQKYGEAYSNYCSTVEKITNAVIAPERIKTGASVDAP